MAKNIKGGQTQRLQNPLNPLLPLNSALSGSPHRKVGEEPLPLNTSRRNKGLNIFLWKGVHYPSAAQNNDVGMSILWPSQTRPRRWHTFTTVSWCFFPKIITNNSCVFTVAAVVVSNVLSDTVGQGPFISCTLHIIHMDRSLPFPKIRHAPCSGWAPGNRAFLRMWRVSQSYIWINHNIHSHPSIFLNFHILILASICAKKLFHDYQKNSLRGNKYTFFVIIFHGFLIIS